MEREVIEVQMLSPSRFVLDKGLSTEREFESLFVLLTYVQNWSDKERALLVVRDREGRERMQVRL